MMTVFALTALLAADLQRGAELFARYCAQCHGSIGASNGPVAPLLFPPARDFSLGRFRLVSTENHVPTDADLVSVLKRGMPGSAMPSWSWMPGSDLESLAAYVRHLAIEVMTISLEQHQSISEGGPLKPGEAREIATARMTPGRVIETGSPAKRDEETLSLGKTLFIKHCASCHGEDGKGKHEQPQWNENGDINWARDFTKGIMKGGASHADLFRRITTGLPGSAMPPTTLSRADTAAIVVFVQTLMPPGADTRLLQSRRTISARHVDGPVPGDPSDPRWKDAIPVDVVLAPLSWTDESVCAAQIVMLHDGNDLAALVRWPDTSRNEEVLGDAIYRDGVALQFSSSREPPIFGMGSQHEPVNIWHWKSFRPESLAGIFELPHAKRDAPFYLPAGATEPPSTGESVRAEGLSSLKRSGAHNLEIRATSRWQNDTWEVVFVRPMLARTEDEVSLDPGTGLYVACAIWNGAASDRGGHKSISIWQQLEIE
jgi:mono/diheme cytochrome c family protein